MRKNTFLRVGLVLTALVVGFIVLGLFWTPYSPNAMDFSRLLPPSAAHPMGTDKFGRDILSRVMVGAGDTLLIALGTVAIGTVAGACCGTSTVTTFVESASGVEAGGRTGLTALTTAVMFLACIFIAPIAAIIPAAATSSALIYVGILMLQGLKNVDFNDLDQIVPVFIMLIAMPISGSIGHGIGLAMISYTIIKVFSGKAKDVSVLTYVIAALFIVKFFAVV